MKHIFALLALFFVCKSSFAQLYPVKNNNLYGVINQDGKLLSEVNAASCLISEDFFALKTDKWTIHDKTGKKLFSDNFDWIMTDKNGFFVFQKNGKKAVLWRTGVLSPAEFDNILSLSAKLVRTSKNSQSEVYDAFGKKIIDNTSGEIFLPDTVKKNSGNLIFLKENNLLKLFSHEKLLADGIENYEILPGEYFFIKKSGLWGCVSAKGKIIANPEFAAKSFIEPAFAALADKGKWGLFSLVNDKQIADVEFDYFEILPDFYGLGAWFFKYQKNKLCGILDEYGKIHIQPSYENIFSLGKSWLAAKKSGKWGLINKQNQISLNFEYDFISDFDANMPVAKLKKEQFEGILNAQGKIIVPLKFDFIEVIRPNKILAYQGQSLTIYEISEKGDVLSEKKYNDLYETGLKNRDLNAQVYFKASVIENTSGNRWVKKNNGKYYLANATGQNLLKTDFDFAYTDPYSKVAVAKIYDQDKNVKGCFLIAHAAGKIFANIPARDVEITDFRENDIARVVRDSTGNYTAFVGKNGKILEFFGEKNQKADTITEFFEGMIAVKTGGKYGFLNSKGETVVPFQYDFADNFRRGTAKIRLNKLFGIIDKTGKFVLPAEFSEISPLTNGYFTCIKNGKYLLADEKGVIILPAEYDKISFVKNGLVRAQKNLLYGIISVQKQIVLPFEYEHIGEISDGFVFIKKAGKWGIADEKGKIILQPSLKAEEVGAFRNGIAWFGAGKFQEKSDVLKRTFFKQNGYITTGGKILVKPEYDFVADFQKIYDAQKGVTKVGKDGKYGFINHKGEEIIPCRYDFIENKFDSVYTHGRGLVQARVGHLWCLIEHTGRELFAPAFEEMNAYENAFDKKGGIFLVKKGEVFGAAALDGSIKIPLIYAEARLSSLCDSIITAKKGNFWGAVSASGREVLPFVYNAIRLVKIGNKVHFLLNKPLSSYTYFNEKYEPVAYIAALDADFPDFERDKNNFSLIPFADEKNLWGLADKNGKTVVEPKFEALYAGANGIFAAKENGKFGYISRDAKFVISPRYDFATAFDKDFAIVSVNKLFGLTDKNGNEILKIEHPFIRHLSDNYYVVGNPDKSKKTLALFYDGKLSKYDFVQIEVPSEGLFAAKSAKENKFGYINEKGEWAISPQFFSANPFSEGTANVRLGESRVSFIDKNGSVFLKAKFAQAGDFSAGKVLADAQIWDKNAAVLGKAEKGIPKGKFIENAHLVSENGFFHVGEDGKKLYEAKFDSLTVFSGGLALAKIGEFWELERKFMDGSLNTVRFSRRGMEEYKKKYPERIKKSVKTDFERFEDVGWKKISEGKWRLIDRAGKPANDRIFDSAEKRGKLLKLRSEGLYGLADINGKIIVEPQFDFAKPADENLIRFETPVSIFYFGTNGKWVFKP